MKCVVIDGRKTQRPKHTSGREEIRGMEACGVHEIKDGRERDNRAPEKKSLCDKRILRKVSSTPCVCYEAYSGVPS